MHGAQYQKSISHKIHAELSGKRKRSRGLSVMRTARGSEYRAEGQAVFAFRQELQGAPELIRRFFQPKELCKLVARVLIPFMN